MDQHEERWTVGCLGVLFVLGGVLLLFLSVSAWFDGEDVRIPLRHSPSVEVRISSILAFGIGAAVGGLGVWGIIDWWKKRNDRLRL